MLTNMKAELLDAKLNGIAIYQFNINNLEWIKYILAECQNNQKPVILGVSMSASKYMGGFKNIYDMVINLIDNLKITIPVSLHLDHASDAESCKEAIDCGFTSVMIDCSLKSLEENIQSTREVVAYAKKNDVLVEGEIGVVDGMSCANIDDCIKYASDTKIDILAPAIGNKHGVYNEEVKLNFDLVDELNNKLNIPLVLHGASGIDDTNLKKVSKLGVSKININTDLQISWFNGLKEGIQNNPDVFDPRKVIGYGEKNLRECVKNKLSLF